jgi:hypothetical protein
MDMIAYPLMLWGWFCGLVGRDHGTAHGFLSRSIEDPRLIIAATLVKTVAHWSAVATLIKRPWVFAFLHAGPSTYTNPCN